MHLETFPLPLRQKRFQHRSFCCTSFFTPKSVSSQKPSTAPMAQGMNHHIVYVTLRSARQCFHSQKTKMKKAFNNGSAGQDKTSHEPKTIGEVWDQMIQGNSPFAVAYRQHKDKDKDELHVNTELCVDLKLLTRQPGPVPRGAYLSGIIVRDADYHFRFIENATPWKAPYAATQRNPLVYRGRFVNVHRRGDGTLYPTFNRPPLTPSFTSRHFCLAAAKELVTVSEFLGDASEREAHTHGQD